MPTSTKKAAAKKPAAKLARKTATTKTVAPSNGVNPAPIQPWQRDLDDQIIKDTVRKLVERRNQLGIQQAAMARAIGCSQPTLSLIEGGRQIPNVAVLFRYARAVGGNLVLLLERW